AASLAELIQFLSIESVSADPKCQPEMKQAAEFLNQAFHAAGLRSEIVPTAGNPIVFAEWLGNPGAPTVLVYGHYDVQPADPLELWTSPPFQPEIRNGNLFARGATDDKGQLYTHVKSVTAWLNACGELP